MTDVWGLAAVLLGGTLVAAHRYAGKILESPKHHVKYMFLVISSIQLCILATRMLETDEPDFFRHAIRALVYPWESRDVVAVPISRWNVYGMIVFATAIFLTDAKSCLFALGYAWPPTLIGLVHQPFDRSSNIIEIPQHLLYLILCFHMVELYTFVMAFLRLDNEKEDAIAKYGWLVLRFVFYIFLIFVDANKPHQVLYSILPVAFQWYVAHHLNDPIK